MTKNDIKSTARITLVRLSSRVVIIVSLTLEFTGGEAVGVE